MVFPKSAIEPLNADSAEAMAFIVSGGVTGLSSNAVGTAER
jgi:uncharacterized membrane protein